MADTQTNRIGWIDAAKGMGIILVLIGHCDIPDVNQYIYIFHMPLFYIISGFCWNIGKNRSISFKDFAKKKFNSYIIPYFKIALICFVVLGIGGNLLRMGFGDEYRTQLLKYIFGIAIYSRGTTEWLPSCSPIWFLTALFFAELIFYWIMKQSRPIVFVAIAGILGFLCYLCGKVFPWNIDNALTAIPYLYVGTIARKYWSIISSVRYLPIMLLACSLIFFFGLLGGDYDGNYLADIHIRGLEAIVISLCLLSVTCIGGGICCSRNI